MTGVEVRPTGPVNGSLAAPGSKSVTNRVLLIAALADGESTLTGPLDSDDTRAMRDAVGRLGARVADVAGKESADGEAGAWRVTGTGGRLRQPSAPIDARLSGTTMRFVAAAAALAPDHVTITGLPGLLARPIGPLTAALRALGVDASDADGFPPIRVGGGIAGGPVEVRAAGSSQFASAVLLVAPYARRRVSMTARDVSSEAYIALTADLMRAWGANVAADGPGRWQVEPGAYQPRDAAVEYDASAAAHLLALAAATGGTVRVTNAATRTQQPDAALPALLERMGCSVSTDGGVVTVTGPAALRPVTVDLGTMPDQVTTVAALAALAEGTSRIAGVAVTRGHETDRLAALAAELGKLGVEVQEHPDGLVVHGGTASGPATLDPHGDHRLAMAFTAIAARVPQVVIDDPGCVDKTYPAFWEDVRRLGVVWRPR